MKAHVRGVALTRRVARGAQLARLACHEITSYTNRAHDRPSPPCPATEAPMIGRAGAWVALVCGVVGLVGSCAGFAYASGWRGLVNEVHVGVEGATVTRVYDADRGVTCYVTSANGYVGGPYVNGSGSWSVQMQCFEGRRP